MADEATASPYTEAPSIRIAGRSTGADLAERYGRRNAVPPEMLVRVTPTKIVARVDIAD